MTSRMLRRKPACNTVFTAFGCVRFFTVVLARMRNEAIKYIVRIWSRNS